MTNTQQPQQFFDLDVDIDNLTSVDIEFVEDHLDMSILDIVDAVNGGVDENGKRPRLGRILTALGFVAQRNIDPTVTLETMLPVRVAQQKPAQAPVAPAGAPDGSGDVVDPPEPISTQPTMPASVSDVAAAGT